MVMSRDQNAGRSHSIKINNSSFERVEEFKYLGTTLAYQNSVMTRGEDTAVTKSVVPGVREPLTVLRFLSYGHRR